MEGQSEQEVNEGATNMETPIKRESVNQMISETKYER